MELLQDVELRKKYDKCKYKVKLWEHNFKKKHGRVPSKLDIREADEGVRVAYRTYFHLKLQALDESFGDLEAFNYNDDVKDDDSQQRNFSETPPERLPENVNTEKTWGAHLNHQPKTTESQEKKDSCDFNSSLSQKLFKGAKISKRNPRKSLSFTQRKSDVGKPNFLSQPSNPTNEIENKEQTDEIHKHTFLRFESDENLFQKENIKVTTTLAKKTAALPLNLIQSAVFEKESVAKRTLDVGWLQRVSQNVGIDLGIEESISQEKQEFDYDSDIIYSSGDEDTTILPVQKKIRLEPTKESLGKIDNSAESFIKEKDVVSENLIQSKVVETEYVLKEKGELIEAVVEQKHAGNTSKETSQESQEKDVIETPVKVEMLKMPTKKGTRSKKSNSNATRRSNRQRKQILELPTNSDDEKEDPFCADEDSDDPTFNEKPEFDTVEIPSTKSKKKVSKTKSKKTETENEEEMEKYELEYSVKPRIVSVPRVRSVKDILKTTKMNRYKKENSKSSEDDDLPAIKTKRQQLKEKLEKKIASGTLNENYLTINLKKKVFVRGRKTTNFSKYKKQQWKKHNKAKALAGPDMDMGGCDGGVLTCFTCGQVGHFARNCTQTKGDALLPLQAEEESPYPTLEEASQMARESVLAVRKPKGVLEPQGNVEETDEEGGEEVFDEEEDEELLMETLRLEEALKLDMREYIDAERVVQPVYGLKEDGNVLDAPSEVYEVLQQFGHTSFRPGQECAVMRILSGKSTLVTLSTGSGKSLCYQIPAYIYSQRQPCITLVISPLVSLMEDQVTGIPTFLKAACLHTNQTKTHREKVMELIASGGLNVLLISPEAVVAGEKATGFGSVLRKLPPIAFACIDEVHCVSQWSHNFRPSYLMICRVLHERLGVKTILGLTATATKATCDSIVRHIKVPDGSNGIINDVPLPDNLCLTVSKDAQKDQALLGLLLFERFRDCKSIIVYCTRRDECERVAGYLRTCLKHERALDTTQKKRKRVDVQAEPYHAGMSASRRKTVQRAFMSGTLRIVVATVAFGMGINKSDIRAVIHYNMPKNFESYVQEIGRAGRDGLPAHCHLFLDSQGKDLNELRRHIHANSIDRHVIRKLLQKIFIPCSCEKTCPKHEVAFSIEETVRALDIPEENISTLLCYLELHKNKYIEVLSPGYVTCKVISYGGANQIRKAAKECPPLAMALVMFKNKIEPESNVAEFPVVEVAATMGWDSGICKHKLKNLEWTSVNEQPKRSLLSVQFSNLGFRVLAPGNLSATELDEALDSLYDHVVTQEKTALLQLQALHLAVTEAAEPSYRTCTETNEKLKSTIRRYFESADPLSDLPAQEEFKLDEERIANDVKALVFMYRDNVFTGRSVARIFHGIQSPNYPAVVWGRCKFWRAHIDADFHSICRIATREILKLR